MRISHTRPHRAVETKRNAKPDVNKRKRTTYTTLYLTALYRTVTASGPRSLERVDHPTEPILEDIRNIPDSVAVREEIPSPGAVAVIIKPGAKDKVGSDAEEETASHY